MRAGGRPNGEYWSNRDVFLCVPYWAPVAGLLDPAYLKSRAALIKDKAEPRTAGTPPGALAFAPDATQEVAGTSHFVVADGKGNVVSMTTTVESVFGTGRMVDGFFLNNQLTDFSFDPFEKDGLRAANAVAGGKRPRAAERGTEGSRAEQIDLDELSQLLGTEQVAAPGAASPPMSNDEPLSSERRSMAVNGRSCNTVLR